MELRTSSGKGASKHRTLWLSINKQLGHESWNTFASKRANWPTWGLIGKGLRIFSDANAGIMGHAPVFGAKPRWLPCMLIVPTTTRSPELFLSGSNSRDFGHDQYRSGAGECYPSSFWGFTIVKIDLGDGHWSPKQVQRQSIAHHW